MKNDNNKNISCLFLASAFGCCAFSFALLLVKAELVSIVFFNIFSCLHLAFSHLFFMKSHDGKGGQ